MLVSVLLVGYGETRVWSGEIVKVAAMSLMSGLTIIALSRWLRFEHLSGIRALSLLPFDHPICSGSLCPVIS